MLLKFWSLYISHSIINIHNYKNIQYYKKKISWYYFLIHLLWNESFFIFTLNCQCQIIFWNHDFCLCLSSHLHLWSLHISSILHLWSLHLWFFICDLFICDSSSVISLSMISSSVILHLWSLHLRLFICAFVFHPWLGTLHWKHKRYQNLKNAIWNKQ